MTRSDHPARLPRHTAAAALLSLAVACGGGGVLAALAFVGPIGGSWSGGTQGNGAWVDDGVNSLDFDGFTDYFASPDASHAATLFSPATDCGDATGGLALTVTFDGPDFRMSVTGDAARANCLSGRFVDEITIRLNAASGPILLRNRLELDPALEIGQWRDLAHANRVIVFKAAVTDLGDGRFSQDGCQFDGGGANGTVVATWRPSDVEAGVLPRIDTMTVTEGSSITTWAPGALVGASGLDMTTPDGPVHLQREPATALTC